MKQSESSSELLMSILQTAEAEALKIRETADSRAEETVDNARDKAAKILNEAEKKALALSQEVKKNSGSSLSLLQSRQERKNSQRLYKEVLNRVQIKLKELSQSPSYRDVLKGFVVEAALGLGENAEESPYIISAGPAEIAIMDQNFIKEVVTELKERFSENYSFIFSSKAALPEQGVELYNNSRRRAFRNCFSARMLRFEDEIQELIDHHLHNNDDEKETP